MTPSAGIDELLRIRAAPLAAAAGRERVAVEIAAAPPPRGAVALVLDLSDSCRAIDRALAACPKLLAALPGAWPLWVYRLSSPHALDPPRAYLLADLCEGRATLARWTESPDEVARGHVGGSLLRPVLDAIQARGSEEQIDTTIALVVTDGALLDVAPLTVPPGVRIVGLAVSGDARPAAWQRVVPGAAFYAIGDRALDEAFRATGNPFFGWTELRFVPAPTGALRAWQVEPAETRAVAVNEPRLGINLASGPAHVVFEGTRDELAALRMSCRAAAGDEVALRLSGAAPLDAGVTALIEAALASPTDGAAAVRLDASSGQPGFDAVWQAARQAREFAERGSPWLADGRLVAFSEPATAEALVDAATGRPKCAAVLCLCRGDAREPPAPDARVVLVGLNRHQQPALAWEPDRPLAFGRAAQRVEIGFDSTDYRWQLRYGDSPPRELSPWASELLPERLLDDEGWIAIFSGDLE